MCADTIGTVPVSWARQSPLTMLKYKYIFHITYTEAVLSNNTGKLLWFELTKMLIAAQHGAETRPLKGFLVF